MKPLSSSDFNPFLRRNAERTPAAEGGRGSIEMATDKSYNMPWQTRPRDLTRFEQDLSSALEAVFIGGAVTLPEIVAGLNKTGQTPPSGGVWTEAIFVETIAKLSTLSQDTDHDVGSPGAGIVPRN